MCVCVDTVTFYFGGGILKLSKLDSLANLNWGGYSEAIKAGLPGKFKLGGGILKLSKLDSLANLNWRGGVFCISE